MAYDKAVDSAQLDAGLTTIADAIRTKGGTTEPLDFPQGMADAVAAISGGGGYPDDTTFDQFATDGDISIVNHTLATPIGNGAFPFRVGSGVNGPRVVSAKFYKTTGVEGAAFKGQKRLSEIYIPEARFIGVSAFEDNGFSFADFNVLSRIDRYAFYNVAELKTLIIRYTGVAVLTASATDIFNGTAIIKGTGYIYVPKALIEQYKVATNWVKVADQIRAIEDYPEITGGTV